MNVATVRLDVAKNVFQVHGVDRDGATMIRRKLRRPDVLSFCATMAPCLVGLKACAVARHWAWEIARLGHDVRLMPPQYVRP
jgi:transposase